MSDYTKQIEDQNEELKKLLAAAQTEIAELRTEPPLIPGILLVSNAKAGSMPSDKLCYMASIILTRSGHDYCVVKNRLGKQGVTISSDEAEHLLRTGDTSCLK